MAKTAAERQADKRKRDKEYMEKMGAEEINYMMFRGTRECLDFIKEAGGFEQDAEAITVMIHTNAAILKRDMSRKDELLSVEQLRKTA